MRTRANCQFDLELCDCTLNDDFLGRAGSALAECIATLFQEARC